MTSKNNQVISNLPAITVSDANGAITGLAVSNLSVYTSAFLGDDSGLTITGGRAGDVLTSTGANGTCNWALPALNELGGTVVKSGTQIASAANIGDTQIYVTPGTVSLFGTGEYLSFVPSPTVSQLFRVTDKTQIPGNLSGILYTATGFYTNPQFYTRNPFPSGTVVSVDGSPLNSTTITNPVFNVLTNSTTYTATPAIQWVGGAGYRDVSATVITLNAPLTAPLAVGAPIYTNSLSPFSIIDFNNNNFSVTSQDGILGVNLGNNISVAGNVTGGGQATFTSNVSLGSNTSSTLLVNMNTADNTYTGMRLNTAGTERWFVGRDSLPNGGSFVINSSGVNILSMTAASNNRTTFAIAGNIVANNIGATAVYSGVDSGNINGSRFPFALWNGNAPISSLSLNSGDLGLDNTAGDFFTSNQSQDTVYTVTYNLVTTGTFTPNIAAGYINITSFGVTTNLALSPGSSFNSNNYYEGSATFKLAGTSSGQGPGRFAIRLNVPGQNATGNITTASTLTVTRIR